MLTGASAGFLIALLGVLNLAILFSQGRLQFGGNIALVRLSQLRLTLLSLFPQLDMLLMHSLQLRAHLLPVEGADNLILIGIEESRIEQSSALAAYESLIVRSRLRQQDGCRPALGSRR